MKREAGFSLIEAVLAVTIISFSVTASVLAIQSMAVFERQTLQKRQALALLDQGVEIVRVLRDNGWTGNIAPLANNTSYYLVPAGSTWQATTTTEVIEDVWYRTVVFGPVYRDAAGRVASAGTLDSGTRLVTVQVSWAGRLGTSTVTSQVYTTNLFND